MHEEIQIFSKFIFDYSIIRRLSSFSFKNKSCAYYIPPWIAMTATWAVAKVRDATFRSQSESRFESAPEVFRHEPVNEWVAAAVDVRQQVADETNLLKQHINKI
jgi:hypothetical protein